MSTYTLRGAIAAAMLCVCASTASADLILLGSNRSVDTGYSFLPDGGFVPMDVSVEDSLFSAGLWDSSVELQEGGVFSGFSRQSSSIMTSGFRGRFRGKYTAEDGLPELGSPLGAGAGGQFVVFFQLTETTMFTLNVTSFVDGVSTASGFQGISVGSYLFPLDDSGTVSETITLGPGGYIFNMTVDHQTDGSGSGAYEHVFSFKVIPGPGALTVLAFGLFAAPRRRRS